MACFHQIGLQSPPVPPLDHLLRLQSVADVGPDSTAVIYLAMLIFFMPLQLCIVFVAFPIKLSQKGSKLSTAGFQS